MGSYWNKGPSVLCDCLLIAVYNVFTLTCTVSIIIVKWEEFFEF